MKIQLLTTVFALGLLVQGTTAEAGFFDKFKSAVSSVTSMAGSVPESCKTLVTSPTISNAQACFSDAKSNPKLMLQACDAACNRVTCRNSQIQGMCKQYCCAAAGENATYAAANIQNCMGGSGGSCSAS